MRMTPAAWPPSPSLVAALVEPRKVPVIPVEVGHSRYLVSPYGEVRLGPQSPNRRPGRVEQQGQTEVFHASEVQSDDEGTFIASTARSPEPHRAVLHEVARPQRSPGVPGRLEALTCKAEDAVDRSADALNSGQTPQFGPHHRRFPWVLAGTAMAASFPPKARHGPTDVCSQAAETDSGPRPSTAGHLRIRGLRSDSTIVWSPELDRRS